MRKCLTIALLALFWAVPAAVSQSAAQGGRYDQQIQQEVNKKLQDKEKLRGVRATVDDGIVTLTGTVDSLMDKINAEKRARNVDHVQGIRDHVQVAGENVEDAKLADRLAEKLRYDRIGYGIMFNSLNLKVNNGVVTIGGTVRDYADRDSALAIVESTPGVKGVIDNIEVAPLSIRDDELRIAVARAIYGHSALQRYAIDPQAPIRIIVKNGNVQLDGVVDSAMDKQIAGMQANSVPGVFSVKNNLYVANEKLK
jgi:hyperosmotically inducible periplasmic protein